MRKIDSRKLQFSFCYTIFAFFVMIPSLIYPNTGYASLKCHDLFANQTSPIDSVDSFARSSLLKPEELRKRLGKYKKAIAGYKLIQTQAELKSEIDRLDNPDELKRLRAYLPLFGKVWGGSTGINLIIGEGTASLWQDNTFELWVQEFVRYEEQAESRIHDLIFDPKAATTVPSWVLHAMQYQIQTLGEALKVKTETEAFLRESLDRKSLTHLTLPESLQAIGFKGLDDFAPQQAPLVLFGKEIHFEVGNETLNWAIIMSGGQKAFNSFKNMAFEGAVVSPLPFEFRPEVAINRGVDLVSSGSGWFQAHILAEDSDIWSYRTVYRTAVIEARLAFLQQVQPMPFLDQMNNTDFKNLIFTLAAYPELLSSPSIWKNFAFPVQGLKTQPELGFIESESYFIKDPSLPDLYVKMVLGKEQIHPEFGETSVYELVVTKPNIELINQLLFSKGESNEIQSDLLERWKAFAKAHSLANDFAVSVEIDPQLMKIKIEVQDKQSGNPNESLRVLGAFFNWIRSEEIYRFDSETVLTEYFK